MLLTGEMIDAATALAWGLVNRVVPADELDAATDALADAHRACEPARRRARQARVLRAGGEPTRPHAYALACGVMVDNAQADDAHEGMPAFLEKRALALVRRLRARGVT